MKEYRVTCFYGNSRLREKIIMAPNEETAEQELKEFVLKQNIRESSITSIHAIPMSTYETKGEKQWTLK